MKMRSKEELKKLKTRSVSELAEELNNAKSKLAGFKRDLALEKLKRTSDIKKTKKYVAQIKTVMREKLELELSSDEKEKKLEK